VKVALFPPARARRATEASSAQLVATGALAGGADPIDGDTRYRQLGVGARDVPAWTRDKARAYSVAAYRANPMARAIIDTYTSFVVGDSGLSPQASHPAVQAVVDRFWRDPRNRLGDLQEALLRDHMLHGETALEMLVGPATGVTRISVIDTTRVTGVRLHRGNPLWPAQLLVATPGSDAEPYDVVTLDDLTGLRAGAVTWWASWKATLTDTRGIPFLSGVLDWLDSYDTVLSNLIDRTALARYLVWDVTLEGASKQRVDEWVQARGGLRAPRSGTVEVHNEKVKWDAKTAQTGSYEDTNTAKAVMTQVAAGAGLAKTWLAEPEDANRATSLSMAEPVRRRVGGVQKLWLGYQAELVRFAVDRAVAAGRLEQAVTVAGPGGGQRELPASETVTVSGPEVAAADAQITADVLVKLSQSLTQMVGAGVMTAEAARYAARKAWEDYVGIPYIADLDRSDGATADDIATEVDRRGGRNVLHAL